MVGEKGLCGDEGDRALGPPGRKGRSECLWVLPSGQDTAEARPDRGAEGYADVKFDPGATCHAANNPAEYGPHKSTYPYAPALSGLHVSAFPPPIYGAIVVDGRIRSARITALLTQRKPELQ